MAAPRLSASCTWNEIQLSGFLSQGFIHSSDNDYLGTESSDGDFDMREYAISGTRRFGSKWRVGAQVFGQRLGRFGHDTPTLDWAIVGYNMRQEFGVRVGRVKMPRGLYNEALDLDIARVQTILPQSVYDARLRDFNASVDGGMFYGNLTFGNQPRHASDVRGVIRLGLRIRFRRPPPQRALGDRRLQLLHQGKHGHR
ncbi:MAG: hypothetical protein ACREIA_17335 [Opitutaceae bacterium]